MVLSATLEGRTSTGGIRELCSHMPDKDMFRWKLEIAVKLREGKPKEALKLADVFKDDGKYPNGIETLVQCPLRHIEIHNLLLKDVSHFQAFVLREIVQFRESILHHLHHSHPITTMFQSRGIVFSIIRRHRNTTC